MTTLKQPLSVLAAVLLLAALAGCSDSDTTPVGTSDTATDDYATIDFDLPYGGLTKSDEDPAFGDPYLIQDDALEGDEVYDDDLLNDPEVQALVAMGDEPGDPEDPTRPRFTFLRLAWGMLDGAVDERSGLATDGELLDWSGLLRVDRGIVVIKRVIRFERPFDSIVRPRIDRQTVAWFSHTGGHFDGLLIQIIEPPRQVDETRDDGDPPPPNQLHIVTGPFEQSFPVASLATIDEVYEVDDLGNAIHLVGFTLGDLDPCPKGFLSGIWMTDTEADDGSGTFRGRWVGVHGFGKGHMMGRFGYNEDGERVFFGKYINRSGQFMGLLGGTWAPVEDRPGHGRFIGHWTSDGETRDGALGGRYLHLPERPGGFYQGRWATDCDPDAVDDIEG
jgi:hypothetical protein